MPRGDGTGPAGMGPMSGRGAGYCAGYGVAGLVNRPMFGGGRGWRNRFWATGVPGGRWGVLRSPFGVPPGVAAGLYGGGFPSAWTREEEILALKGQLSGFEQAVGQIKARLAELAPEEK